MEWSQFGAIAKHLTHGACSSDSAEFWQHSGQKEQRGGRSYSLLDHGVIRLAGWLAGGRAGGRATSSTVCTRTSRSDQTFRKVSSPRGGRGALDGRRKARREALRIKWAGAGARQARGGRIGQRDRMEVDDTGGDGGQEELLVADPEADNGGDPSPGQGRKIGSRKSSPGLGWLARLLE